MRARGGRGTFIHLDIEPEPDCVARKHRRDDRVLRASGCCRTARRCWPPCWGSARTTAGGICSDHVAVCFDCCHFAVEYEDPAAALERLGGRHPHRPRAAQLGAARARSRRRRRRAAAVADRLRRSPTRPTCTRSSSGRRTTAHAIYSTTPGSRPGALDAEQRSTSPTQSGEFIFTCRSSPPNTRRLGSTQDYVRDGPRARACDPRSPAPRDRDLHLGRAAARGSKIDVLESIAREYEWVLPHTSAVMRSADTRSDNEDRRPQRRRPDTAASIGRGMPQLARGPRRRRWRASGRRFPPSPARRRPTTSPAAIPRRTASSATAGTPATTAEVKFWKQSNQLVQAPKIWDAASAADPSFTCANLFWWYNMYSTADYTVTPRPMYPADGRKLPDIYTTPGDLRDELQSDARHVSALRVLGTAGVDRVDAVDRRSGEGVEQKFIADADARLPAAPRLQPAAGRPERSRGGRGRPAGRRRLRRPDRLLRGRGAQRHRPLRVRAFDVTTPVHLNRVLREHGLITVREELGLEVLDPGASAAFAVADHQVAHVYVNDPSTARRGARDPRERRRASSACSTRDGQGARQARPPARRRPRRDRRRRTRGSPTTTGSTTQRAPDFARTVDIHRKPGYDPVELFLDPAIRVPAADRRLEARQEEHWDSGC